MIEKKHAAKKVFLIFAVISVIVVSVSGIYAVTNLPAVPQKIGLDDVTFNDLNRPYCENCHGESVANIHHATKNAVSGNCVSCHAVEKKQDATGVIRKTNCMDCHKKSPHHVTEAAKNRECNSCHETEGLSDYNQKDVPGYKISKITPTKVACRKCHHDGQVGNKKVFSFKKTHHAIGLKGCDNCHEKNKSTVNIRVCERCHNVKAIHEVGPHVVKDACVHCHDMKQGSDFIKTINQK